MTQSSKGRSLIPVRLPHLPEIRNVGPGERAKEPVFLPTSKTTLSLKASPSKRGQPDLSDATLRRRRGAVAAALRSIRSAMSTIRAEYRAGLRLELAKAYRLAEYLRRTPDAWAAFCEDRHWDSSPSKPADRDRSNALRYVLKRVVGGSESLKNKRVSKYFRALQPLLESGVAASHIPDVIKGSGGIEALARAHAAPRSSGNPAAARADASESANLPTAVPSIKADVTEAASVLEVEVPKEMLLDALSLEDGQSALLSIRASGSRGSWKVIKGTRLRRK